MCGRLLHVNVVVQTRSGGQCQIWPSPNDSTRPEPAIAKERALASAAGADALLKYRDTVAVESPAPESGLGQETLSAGG